MFMNAISSCLRCFFILMERIWLQAPPLMEKNHFLLFKEDEGKNPRRRYHWFFLSKKNEPATTMQPKAKTKKKTTLFPHLFPGFSYVLQGRIIGLKSKRPRQGCMTFEYLWRGKYYALALLPQQGRRTKDYAAFYQESVHIDVVVKRCSMLKKPSLILHSIQKNNEGEEQLFLKL